MAKTAQEIYDLEQSNTRSIHLLPEGMFLKAYERSAFALCELVRPFKTSKRSYKVLGRESLVSVGFPAAEKDKILSGFVDHVAESDGSLTVSLSSDIDIPAFKAWKDSIPVKAQAVQAEQALTEPSDLQQRIRSFDLATKTPMDCMLFVAELKKLLA